VAVAVEKKVQKMLRADLDQERDEDLVLMGSPRHCLQRVIQAARLIKDIKTSEKRSIATLENQPKLCLEHP